jgi:hypothetical protein
MSGERAGGRLARIQGIKQQGIGVASCYQIICLPSDDMFWIVGRRRPIPCQSLEETIAEDWGP